MQQVDLKYTYTYGDRTTQDFSPLNVGFGLTYSLPIIVAILKANPNDLIIIENPESHLHPKAQSKLAELFALASSIGIQLIIETHSDHILNGIRVATKKGLINSEQTKIYYLSKEENKLGIINLNNMIPIIESEITLLDVDSQPESYKVLLTKQIAYIRKNKELIASRAAKLRDVVIKGYNTKAVAISCNFQLLEKGFSSFTP